MTRTRAGIGWALLFVAGVAFGAQATPPGWFMAGSSPQDYSASLDQRAAHGGKSSARLQAIVAAPRGFGTLMQEASADAYRGKRVRLSAFVRSDAVGGWAGIWMRVDGAAGGPPLAFDNMQDRAILGSSDWTRYSIVLDVPGEASMIAYGVLLQGTGRVWMDDVQFEVVDRSVPTTGGPVRPGRTDPSNLDFEQ